MHLNVGFSTESELKAFLDFLYAKSGQSISFTGLLEAMCHEVTIVTAVHNIKSNKGSKTAGVDEIKMDSYLQMPKQELIDLIQRKFHKYQPKPARRVYIPKSNGKQRPLGIPSAIDRVVQECMRIVLEPICEAQFYPHSYGFRPYRAQKHAIRDIVNVINAGCRSPDQPVWAVEGDIKGCFDNINHRLLLQKLWRMGIHDKRVLSIIKAMLKAGYIESGIYYGYPFEETEDIELTLQKIYEAKILESDLSCAVLTIQLHRLTFLPGTVIAEEYYNELEFEGINTMSYFDEDVEIPLEIRELMLQNKTGFLNCYNLRENMNKFFNHLGDFVCLWFNLYYIRYRKTIDLVFQHFQKLISFFEYVYNTDASFFLETSRFSGVYFGEDRDNLLCAAFEEFIVNHFANNQVIIHTLNEEMLLAEIKDQ